MNIELLRTLAQAIADKREVEAQLREVKRRIAELQPVCLTEMVSEGVPRLPVTLEDGRTVTLYSETRHYAKVKEGCKQALANAFHLAGYGELVQPGVNAQTLSAFVNERAREGEPIPMEIAAVIDTGDTTMLKGRITG